MEKSWMLCAGDPGYHPAPCPPEQTPLRSILALPKIGCWFVLRATTGHRFFSFPPAPLSHEIDHRSALPGPVRSHGRLYFATLAEAAKAEIDGVSLLAHFRATRTEDQARALVRRLDPATVIKFLGSLIPPSVERLSRASAAERVLAKHPYEALALVVQGRQVFQDQLAQAEAQVSELKTTLADLQDSIKIPRRSGPRC